MRSERVKFLVRTANVNTGDEDASHEDEEKDKAGQGRENGEAGAAEFDALRDGEGKVEKDKKVEELSGEKRLPVDGPRDPELSVTDERFGVHNALDEKPPTEGHENDEGIGEQPERVVSDAPGKGHALVGIGEPKGTISERGGEDHEDGH